MSRTIRRKTKKIRVDSWVLWDCSSRVGFMQYGKFSPQSEEGKKAIAKYHSDAGCGDLWYKSRAGWAKYYERRNIRRVCDQALHRYFSGIDEDCIVPTYKHNWLD